MKDKGRIAKQSGLVGAGIGLAVFALFGLLQGSMIGGAVGLDIINNVLHEQAGVSMLSRVILGASMLAGVLVAGAILVLAFSAAGYALGFAVGWLFEPKAAAYEGSKNQVH
jgi:hypothetical protein